MPDTDWLILKVVALFWQFVYHISRLEYEREKMLKLYFLKA